VHNEGLGVKQAAMINRLRRRAERWIDMLIGGLMGAAADVREFAIDAERADDFAADLSARRGEPGGDQAWRLALLSMRNAFQSGLSVVAANPDANSRIAASVMACFPEDLFDSTGIFQSLWMTRLTAVTSDAQGLLSELLQPSPRPRPAPRRFDRLT
jgi:hypothetical protein